MKRKQATKRKQTMKRKKTMKRKQPMKWSVYWTHMGNGEVIDPPRRSTTYTHEDINECFRELAENILKTEWQGYVDECKE